MAYSKYEKARAVKTNNRTNFDSDDINSKSFKRGYRKVKKSPLLIVIVLALLVGAVAGFFVAKSTCGFYMNGYNVNGVAATENDYVYVDMTQHKEQLIDADKKSGSPVGVTTGQVYSTMKLEDLGVSAKFFGFDITDTVSIQYYFREDISHDMKKVASIDVATAGVYYIEYTSSHFAYKNVNLIRTVVITEVEVDG